MKIKFKKINGVYIVEPLETVKGEFIVDGHRYRDITKKHFKHKPYSIKYIEVKEWVKSYGELSPEEFEKKRLGFILDMDIEGNPIFYDLDSEYRYKKFVEAHPAVIEKFEDISYCEVTSVKDEIMEMRLSMIGLAAVYKELIQIPYSLNKPFIEESPDEIKKALKVLQEYIINTKNDLGRQISELEKIK